MDALFPRGAKQRDGEINLRQRLAAGDGHAAAGIQVKRAVLNDVLHDLADSHGASNEFQCP